MQFRALRVHLGCYPGNQPVPSGADGDEVTPVNMAGIGVSRSGPWIMLRWW